jgi:hypothetical protein
VVLRVARVWGFTCWAGVVVVDDMEDGEHVADAHGSQSRYVDTGLHLGGNV